MNSLNKVSVMIAGLTLLATVNIQAAGMGGSKNQDGMGMGMGNNMSDQRDMPMHDGDDMGYKDRFRRMDQIMEKAHNTKDAKKHYELMQEHMDDMMEGMSMMRNNMGSGYGDQMGMGKGRSESGDMDDMMGQRLDRFERRMDMMHEMMDQMVRHQREEMRMRGQ